MRRLKKNSGFSMMELLVVIGILTVFSTFSIISYSSYRHGLTIKNASIEIENMLNNARARAINQNSHFSFVYDFRSREFWIDEIASDGSVKIPKVFSPKQLDENVKMTNAIIGAVNITNDLASVHFYPEGRSSYSRFYLIRTGDNESQAVNYYTVLTYSSTGITHIFPNEKR